MKRNEPFFNRKLAAPFTRLIVLFVLVVILAIPAIVEGFSANLRYPSTSHIAYSATKSSSAKHHRLTPFSSAFSAMIAPSNSYSQLSVTSSQSYTSSPPTSPRSFLSMSGVNEWTRQQYSGKTVVLTGATGGLGSAFALQLSKFCGVSTLILSARQEDALKKLALECKKVACNRSMKVLVMTCDLSNPKSVEKLAEQIFLTVSTVDVLINNGGVSSRSRFVDTTLKVDEQVMQINFLSGAALAKAVVPGMARKGSGRIIWVSSVQGLVGIPNRSSYAASKFAVQGYCESIRGELANSGISVLAASPGYIRTNLSSSAITGDGSAYGKTDETTANGSDPNDVAIQILESAARGDAEIVVAAGVSAKAAIWLKFFCPWLLRWQLVERYEKSQKNKDV